MCRSNFSKFFELIGYISWNFTQNRVLSPQLLSRNPALLTPFGMVQLLTSL